MELLIRVLNSCLVLISYSLLCVFGMYILYALFTIVHTYIHIVFPHRHSPDYRDTDLSLSASSGSLGMEDLRNRPMPLVSPRLLLTAFPGMYTD
jgi:hypothetical protein